MLPELSQPSIHKQGSGESIGRRGLSVRIHGFCAAFDRSFPSPTGSYLHYHAAIFKVSMKSSFRVLSGFIGPGDRNRDMHTPEPKDWFLHLSTSVSHPRGVFCTSPALHLSSESSKHLPANNVCTQIRKRDVEDQRAGSCY